MDKMTETKENIFLFVPNIIGFARVILAIVAFYFMPTNCVFACTCYVTSALLDAFDGHAARLLNQRIKSNKTGNREKLFKESVLSAIEPIEYTPTDNVTVEIGTKFGAMLDQLTDRAGTAGLMMTLATFYPKYTFWFQMSMVIDITCHWLYLHTVTLQGKTSHKFIDMSENPIMHVYYTNKNVLFFMCAGNEAFYAALYVAYFYTGPTVLGVGLFKLIALLSMPVAVIKTGISVIHGIVASMNLSIIDTKERAAIAEKKAKE